MGLDFTSNVAGLNLPVFLRKIDRKGDWGHDVDSVEQRLGQAVSKIFHGCESCFSVYTAASVDDLRAIVVGLNSGRQSSSQQIDFLAFTADEIQTTGIRLVQTAGETDCHRANRLHLDAHFRDTIDLLRLCKFAMDSKRVSFRISRGDAKQIFDTANEDGCGAVVAPPHCGCEPINQC